GSGARATLHARPRTAPRGRARRARRLRGRVHAHRPSGRDRARADSSRPERHRPGDDLPARRRRPHRNDDPALPDRGHAARAGGAARMTVTVHMHGNLRRFMPEGRDRLAIELEAGTTIETLLVSLGAAGDTWLVAVNGGPAAPAAARVAPSEASTAPRRRAAAGACGPRYGTRSTPRKISAPRPVRDCHVRPPRATGRELRACTPPGMRSRNHHGRR